MRTMALAPEQTSGLTASVDYVVTSLTDAGWDVEQVPFTYLVGANALLDQLTPVAAAHPTSAAIGTGAGDVTGNVIPVDIGLTPPRPNSSGCEAGDYVGLGFEGSDDIALVQRGTCAFAVKAIAAEAAGAEAVIIFNRGNTDAPDRNDLFTPTLVRPTGQRPRPRTRSI